MTALTRKVVWTVTGAYILLLAGVSLLPSGAGVLGGWDTAISPGLQNLLHVPAYAVLVILVILALRPSFKTGLASMAWISLGCCVFGLVLEFAQAAIPGRTGSLTDVLLNTAGVAVGCLAAIWWRAAIRTRQSAFAPVKTASKTGKPDKV
ncbi:MAG: VanZ family protein [Planctomycetota bacterium]|nr:VanZ family protein [Planctomycetota bacterium]